LIICQITKILDHKGRVPNTCMIIHRTRFICAILPIVKKGRTPELAKGFPQGSVTFVFPRSFRRINVVLVSFSANNAGKRNENLVSFS